MKKSSIFFKFLTIFSVFALVLTVGFTPTVAKASEDNVIINPDSADENGYRLRVLVEALEYGQWVTKLSRDVYSNMEDYSWVFEIDSGLIDHAQENFRIRFIYEYHYFLSQNLYNFENYFEFAFGSNEYYMSFAKMNVYSSVNEYMWSSIYGNVAMGSNYPDFSASVSPYVNSQYICIEFVSNFHEQFQTSGTRDQCYFMIGSGYIPITCSQFIPTYPDFNLPDADVDGLQDFSSFAPSGALQNFFDSVFEYRFVGIAMLMLVSMGVLAFLLYGERK